MATFGKSGRRPDPGSKLEFKFEGGRPVSRQFGDLTLTVSGRAVADGMTIPVLSIAQDRRVIFQTAIQESATTGGNAEIRVARLDAASSEPQIVFSSFWGGAHCCTVTRIVTRVSGQWRAIDGRTLDGDGGYGLEDIDGDGAHELVSVDNSFLYRFASYAGSHAPTRIERLVGDRILDATRDPRFQPYLRQDLFRQEHWASLQPEIWRQNGFLGGWVAAKALVGQFDEAWSRMTGLYERNPDWTMTVCSVAATGGRCPKGFEREVDFPTALRQHLEATGYIAGRARPTARRSLPLPRRRSPSCLPACPRLRLRRRRPNAGARPERVSSRALRDMWSPMPMWSRTAAPHAFAQEAARPRSPASWRVTRQRPGLARDRHEALKVRDDPAAARLGESVAVFGFPLSSVLASSGNFTLGNVTALAGLGDDTRFLQISAPVQPGNSGGPLLDENGNVIGVVTSKLNALRTLARTGDIPQNVNFAIRASALTAFLENRRVASAGQPKTARLSPPDLAEEATAMSVQVLCE